ncbi:MAG: DNA mismatch repair endonuclease MutL, partial [Nannocystaceae bacterium]
MNISLNSVATPDRPIALLNQTLADQIAAGEVVERPASVAKELVENAIDAGATRVDVELVDGGLTSIRVLDNGRGIRADELELALTRHATSKVASPEDLVEIHSLGFRGEALASISAVAHVTLRSRRPGDDVGHELRSLPGTDLQNSPVGMPIGTQVEVRSLFACVPARRKFMRSEATEVGHCSEALIRIALVHPEVHLTLRHGRRELVNFRPATPGQRVEQILLRRGPGPFQALAGEADGVRVEGWLGQPGSAIRGRSGIILVVRRRVVRERSLSQIVTQAYGDTLASGHYPVACLFIEPPRGSVDVNVHPQKAEVRFRDPQQVYAAVRSVLRGIFQVEKPTVVAAASPADSPGRASPRSLGAVEPSSSLHVKNMHEQPLPGQARSAAAPIAGGEQASAQFREDQTSSVAGQQGGNPAAKDRSETPNPGQQADRRIGPPHEATSHSSGQRREMTSRDEQVARSGQRRDATISEKQVARPSGQRRDATISERQVARPSEAAISDEQVARSAGQPREATSSDEQVERPSGQPRDATSPSEGRGRGYRLATRALDGNYERHKRTVMEVVDWMKEGKSDTPAAPKKVVKVGLTSPPPSPPQELFAGEGPALGEKQTPPQGFRQRAAAVDDESTNNSEMRVADGRIVPALLTCLPGPVAVFASGDELLAVDLKRLRSHLVYQRLTREISWRREVGVQRLLSPAIVRRPSSEVRLCVAARAELLTLGIDLDAFGEDALVVRGVPAHLRHCIDDADVA